MPLRERHEIPPLDQTLLSKALSIWGIGSKPCHTQGMSRLMMVRKTEKKNYPWTRHKKNSWPQALLTTSSEIFLHLGEAGSMSLTSPSRDVKQSQPKGRGNKMVKPWGPGIQKHPPPSQESGPKQQRNQKPRTSNHKPQQSSTNGVGAVGGTKVWQKEEHIKKPTSVAHNHPILQLST